MQNELVNTSLLTMQHEYQKYQDEVSGGFFFLSAMED